jgi:hypothetical protein
VETIKDAQCWSLNRSYTMSVLDHSKDKSLFTIVCFFVIQFFGICYEEMVHASGMNLRNNDYRHVIPCFPFLYV